MAVQDRAAAWNATAAPADRLELRVALHAGELAGGRVEAGVGPLPVAERALEAAPRGAIWLTRVVALTMNQSEVPVEPVAEAVEGPGGERLSLYRVRPAPGPQPFGGRAAGQVPKAHGVSRLLEPVSDSISSIEDGGEGRGRAVARVTGATATLLALGVAEAGLLVAGGAVVVSGRVAGRGAEAPWAARAFSRVQAARGWLSRRRTVSRAALERPLR
jgi:hypothetical protein